MVIAVVIFAVCDSLESPTADLATKATVLSMAKVQGDDLVFKFLLLHNPPRSSMRQPGDNFFVSGVGQDHAVIDNNREQAKMSEHIIGCDYAQRMDVGQASTHCNFTGNVGSLFMPPDAMTAPLGINGSNLE